MGWMHDFLHYMSLDPIYRRFHQSNVTFSIMYAFQEHFILVLSHDEVVHGKGSMINKMPGDEWQKFANLRMFYAWMYRAPGQEAALHGGRVWADAGVESRRGLDWELTNLPRHDGLRRLVQHLNHVYRSEPALWDLDDTYEGFEWIDFHDADQCVVAFLRRSQEGELLVFAVNATPVVRYNYRLGVPHDGFYREIINTDGETYGGSNVGNLGGLQADASGMAGADAFDRDQSAAAGSGGIQARGA